MLTYTVHTKWIINTQRLKQLLTYTYFYGYHTLNDTQLSTPCHLHGRHKGDYEYQSVLQQLLTCGYLHGSHKLIMIPKFILKKTLLIITGDFNVDLLTTNYASHAISQLLINTCSYTQLIKGPTTDYNSCLDHIYTNIPNDQITSSGILESYYR